MVSPVIDLVWTLLSRYGDPVAAATLVGAVDDGSLPHINALASPASVASVPARLAQRLSAEDLAACRRIGAAMTYEQVIEYALERLEGRARRFGRTLTTSCAGANLVFIHHVLGTEQALQTFGVPHSNHAIALAGASPHTPHSPTRWARAFSSSSSMTRACAWFGSITSSRA